MLWTHGLMDSCYGPNGYPSLCAHTQYPIQYNTIQWGSIVGFITMHMPVKPSGLMVGFIKMHLSVKASAHSRSNTLIRLTLPFILMPILHPTLRSPLHIQSCLHPVLPYTQSCLHTQSCLTPSPALHPVLAKHDESMSLGVHESMSP